jgi:hypothetical protein
MILSARTVYSIFFLVFISLQSIAQTNFTATGRVIDFDTKQSLKNVSITLRLTKMGTITDDSGYFSLTVRDGKQQTHYH